MATQLYGYDDTEMWQQSLRSEVPESDILPLQAEGTEFFALYHHSELGHLSGGVILLHDQGAHPDWPGAFQELRAKLPGYGWSTMSIQLQPNNPIRMEPTIHTDEEYLFEQMQLSTSVRIDAAVAAMAEFKVEKLVLLGHGISGRLAVDYLQQRSETTPIRGLILLSMDGSETSRPELDIVPKLRAIAMPILDIYGQQDITAVVESAKRRKTVAVTAPPGERRTHTTATDFLSDFDPHKVNRVTYRQIAIANANHHFLHKERELLHRIVGWLRRYVAK